MEIADILSKSLTSAFTYAGIFLWGVVEPFVIASLASFVTICTIKWLWGWGARQWYAFEGFSSRQIRRKIKKGNCFIELLAAIVDLFQGCKRH